MAVSLLSLWKDRADNFAERRDKTILCAAFRAHTKNVSGDALHITIPRDCNASGPSIEAPKEGAVAQIQVLDVIQRRNDTVDLSTADRSLLEQRRTPTIAATKRFQFAISMDGDFVKAAGAEARPSYEMHRQRIDIFHCISCGTPGE